MSTAAAIRSGHLDKVRIDLHDAGVALGSWWDRNHLDESRALYDAVEALTRAVSTMALVLESDRA